MAKNLEQLGDTILFTAGADVVSGDVVFPGNDLAAIALVDILNTETGSAMTVGVFTLAKNTGVAITQGDRVNYDTAAAEVTTAALSGTVLALGVAWKTTIMADTEIDVKINAGIGTFA